MKSSLLQLYCEHRRARPVNVATSAAVYIYLERLAGERRLGGDRRLDLLRECLDLLGDRLRRLSGLAARLLLLPGKMSFVTQPSMCTPYLALTHTTDQDCIAMLVPKQHCHFLGYVK